MGRIVSSVFRARDAATAVAMYHAACDMLEECCPRAAAVLEEAEPDALAYLDFPPTHWKRLRTNNVRQQGNQAPLARGAGLPVGEFAAQARGRRHVRPGRNMVRLALLLGEEDGRDA